MSNNDELEKTSMTTSFSAVHMHMDEAISQLFQCSFCLEEYKNPKALPCLHTYCTECLVKHIRVFSKKNQETFECPECRVATKIPSMGALGFPDNFMINNAKEMLKNFNSPNLISSKDKREKALYELSEIKEEFHRKCEAAEMKLNNEFSRLELKLQQYKSSTLQNFHNFVKSQQSFMQQEINLQSSKSDMDYDNEKLLTKYHFQNGSIDYTKLSSQIEFGNLLKNSSSYKFLSTFRKPKLKYLFQVNCDWLMDMCSYGRNMILVKRISSHCGSVVEVDECSGIQIRELYMKIPARCAVVDNLLYVTDWVDTTLQTINLKEDKINKAIDLYLGGGDECNPFNLFSCQNSLLVLHHKKAEGLASLIGPNLISQIKNVLPLQNKFHWYGCHINSSRIAITDKEEGCVRIFDMMDKSNHIVVSKGIEFPAGLFNDYNCSRILLADRKSNKILILDYDGNVVGELLNSDDGLRQPRLVYVNEITNSLYVGEQDGCVRVYEYNLYEN